MKSFPPNPPALLALLIGIAANSYAQDAVPTQEVPPAPPPPNHGATLVPNPQIPPPDTWLPRQTATLRLLDKVASRVSPLTLNVGATIQAGSLSITLTACDTRPPDLPRDSTAHLKIIDNDNAGNFDGWILANEPGLAVFEHPVYDIQLVACG